MLKMLQVSYAKESALYTVGFCLPCVVWGPYEGWSDAHQQVSFISGADSGCSGKAQPPSAISSVTSDSLPQGLTGWKLSYKANSQRLGRSFSGGGNGQLTLV